MSLPIFCYGKIRVKIRAQQKLIKMKSTSENSMQTAKAKKKPKNYPIRYVKLIIISVSPILSIEIIVVNIYERTCARRAWTNDRMRTGPRIYHVRSFMQTMHVNNMHACLLGAFMSVFILNISSMKWFILWICFKKTWIKEIFCVYLYRFWILYDIPQCFIQYIRNIQKHMR